MICFVDVITIILVSILMKFIDPLQ